MIMKQTMSFPVSIFIAGDYETALQISQSYCDKVGLCVTVSKTVYVYTGGSENGIIVGLINYPRFPTPETDIFRHALELAKSLRVGLDQQSFSIQTADDTYWYSWRESDV